MSLKVTSEDFSPIWELPLQLEGAKVMLRSLVATEITEIALGFLGWSWDLRVSMENGG